jgi:hypothetical protein
MEMHGKSPKGMDLFDVMVWSKANRMGGLAVRLNVVIPMPAFNVLDSRPNRTYQAARRLY